MRKILVLTAVALMSVSAAVAAPKSDNTAAKKAQGDPMAAKMANMSPEQKAAMEKAMKLGSPSEAHHRLDPLVGRFNTTVRWWMDPNATPEESKGVENNQWILGGRFIQQEFKGTSMGQPFQGMGIIGYDNVKQEYTSIWLDSMSTGMMQSTGRYDELSKTFVDSGTFSCPMTGEKSKTFRSETKWTDNNHYTYTWFTKDKDGKEFKSMEIMFERMGNAPSKVSKK